MFLLYLKELSTYKRLKEIFFFQIQNWTTLLPQFALQVLSLRILCIIVTSVIIFTAYFLHI